MRSRSVVSIIKNHKMSVFLFFMVVLLLFIIADEATITTIVKYTAIYQPSSIWFLTIIFCVQIIFATIQSVFSDIYPRRRILLIALLGSLASLVLLNFTKDIHNLLLIAIIIKGIFGNIIPVSRAALADITPPSRFRFVLALSILAISFGSWIPSHIINVIPHDSLITTLILFVLILALICKFAFTNKRSSEINNSLEIRSKLSKASKFIEFRVLYKEFIKNPSFIFCILTYLFAEASFYQLFVRHSLILDHPCLEILPVSLGIGYLVGTFILLSFFKVTNKNFMFIGMLLSLTSLLFLFFFEFENYSRLNILHIGILFFIFSLGYALFIPSLFSFISAKHSSHDQGKIYGLVESTDAFAYLVSFIFVANTSKFTCFKSLIVSFPLLLLSFTFMIYTHKIKRLKRKSA